MIVTTNSRPSDGPSPPKRSAPRESSDRTQQILAMHSDGVLRKEIAETFRLSVSHVAAIIHDEKRRLERSLLPFGSLTARTQNRLINNSFIAVHPGEITPGWVVTTFNLEDLRSIPFLGNTGFDEIVRLLAANDMTLSTRRWSPVLVFVQDGRAPAMSGDRAQSDRLRSRRR